MTRKRFVKLLMSKGMSRNSANAFAMAAGPKKSHETLYRETSVFLDGNALQVLIEKLQKGIFQIFNVVGVAFENLGGQLLEIGKAFQRHDYQVDAALYAYRRLNQIEAKSSEN